ncbi:MAG: hypothetical protein P8X93_03940 [Gammaproteobacteria bacterium]|jgi:hypothetical protein
MKHSLKIDPSASESHDLDSLQAGLFYLTTQYSIHPCTRIASKIVEHLDMLCSHPHIALVPEQNRIYSKLINLWRARLLQDISGLNRTLH